ncbi:MAG: (Fe-S)-binding protein [Candidatus Thorarchaeota archaeon]
MTTKDYLTNDIADDIWHCMWCMMCKAQCTVHYHTRREEDAPEPRVHLVEQIRRGIFDWDEVSAEIVQNCTLCGLCTEWCVSRQDIPNIMRHARADLVNIGKAPPSVMAVDKSLKEDKNTYGKKLDERFAKLNLEGQTKSGADVVFYVGCLSSYDRVEIANDMIKILDAAGVKYTVMDDEWCCGGPAYALGLWDTAKEMAEHNKQAIEATGVKTVITTCPGCAKALRKQYPEWGIDIDAKVIHHTEYIEQLLKDGKIKLKKPLKKTMTYHDPCHLGRDLDVYDPPRDVLKKIDDATLVEMFANREKALCCGSGGGFKLTNPDTANEMGSRITREAKQVDADLMVSACPLCKESFCKDAEEKGLEVKDLAEIIADLI